MEQHLYSYAKMKIFTESSYKIMRLYIRVLCPKCNQVCRFEKKEVSSDVIRGHVEYICKRQLAQEAKHSKPFSDGDFFLKCMLDVADQVCP